MGHSPQRLICKKFFYIQWQDAWGIYTYPAKNRLGASFSQFRWRIFISLKNHSIFCVFLSAILQRNCKFRFFSSVPSLIIDILYFDCPLSYSLIEAPIDVPVCRDLFFLPTVFIFKIFNRFHQYHRMKSTVTLTYDYARFTILKKKRSKEKDFI